MLLKQTKKKINRNTISGVKSNLDEIPNLVESADGGRCRRDLIVDKKE